MNCFVYLFINKRAQIPVKCIKWLTARLLCDINNPRAWAQPEEDENNNLRCHQTADSLWVSTFFSLWNCLICSRPTLCISCVLGNWLMKLQANNTVIILWKMGCFPEFLKACDDKNNQSRLVKKLAHSFLPPLNSFRVSPLTRKYC